LEGFRQPETTSKIFKQKSEIQAASQALQFPQGLGQTELQAEHLPGSNPVEKGVTTSGEKAHKPLD